ncbi:YciI family protein [Streptomyces sp. NPDC020875]|uniref:YciI family protein n=1 Tax=Streptomyces sp. NPDC020875 TaxID=3154898 RepID=UPI0033D9D270
MKYLVQIQGTQAAYDAMAGKPSPGNPAWSEADIAAMFAHMGAINDDLAETGELVDGNGLAEPARTRYVLSGPGGKPVITDGPYSETKEVLAGYWVLDCASLDRVTEIAARVVACPIPEGSTPSPIIIQPIQEAPPES